MRQSKGWIAKALVSATLCDVVINTIIRFHQYLEEIKYSEYNEFI